MRVVFVTREVWPFVTGGGIARYVSDAVAALSGRADVTVLTTDRFEPEYRELAAAGDPRVGGARWRFAPEPAEDLSPFWTNHHAWSAAACAALRELCLAERPDVIEFEDYGGPGAVTLHAARAGDPAFRDVRLIVRAHTAWEMTQVLDGVPLDGLAARTVMALERDALRLADRVLAPAGTLAAYGRHYGHDALAPGLDSPPPFHADAAEPQDREPPSGDRLRLLFLGRMQKLKGVEELVRALRLVDRDDVELTLVGGDTETAGGGGSMVEHLRSLAAGDPRLTFRDPAQRHEIAALMREHHLVVVPSHFESFSYVVREALAANRPVLAADVGGLATDFEPGRSGWLLERAEPAELAARIGALADDREAIESLIREGAPRTSLDAATGDERYVQAMLALAVAPPAPAVPDALGPVTAIVTACAGEGPLEPTLASLEAQQHPGLEVVVAAEDVDLVPVRALGRIHALVLLDPETKGANAARAAGLQTRRGSGPVLLIRSGEQLGPDFLARALGALTSDHTAAYATTYARGRTPGSVPLGNAGAWLVGEYDVAATVALFREGTLPLGAPAEPGRDDRALFDALVQQDRFGAVIPERLVERRLVRRVGDAGLAARSVWATLARSAL